MKKQSFLIVLFLWTALSGYGIEKGISLKTPTGDLYGSMILPDGPSEKGVIALFICGSGPTDRNGNNPHMKNNSIKYLAEALGAAGIPSVRYDKRAIGASAKAAMSESELRFSMYVDDAKAWIDLLSKSYRKVVLIGHSEGSTIAILAAMSHPKVGGLVSIAGPGRVANEILKQQLADQPQMVKDSAYPIIDKLKAGQMVNDVPPMLNVLFRQSIQPYLISWFAVDPAHSIRRVKIPTLLIQGDKDIQVGLEELELLHQAQPRAQKVIVPDMNHVFKPCLSVDKMSQMAAYNTISLKNVPAFESAVVQFVKTIK